MPVVYDSEHVETAEWNGAPSTMGILIGCVIGAAAVLVWTVCACCAPKTKREKTGEAKKGGAEKLESSKTVESSQLGKSFAGSPKGGLAPLPPPGPIVETRIIPALLQQPSTPIPTTTAEAAADDHYFEIGGESQMKRGGAPSQKQLPADAVPGREPIYRTLYNMDSKFESSKMAKKNAAATMMPTDAKTAVAPSVVSSPQSRAATPSMAPATASPSLMKKGTPSMAPAVTSPSLIKKGTATYALKKATGTISPAAKSQSVSFG